MNQAQPNDLLALAAVMQAASLVDEVAFQGSIKERACFNASIKSVLQPNKEDVGSIYSSVDNLKIGIRDLEKYLSRNTQEPGFANKLKYMAQLNRLGSLLSTDQSMSQSIGTALAEANKHKKSTPTLIKYLAKVYYDNFSSLPANKRIIVLGKKEYLRPEKNVETIRALLFAGVRASLLWRIYGRGMLSLFLNRKKMLQEIHSISNN